MIWPPTVIAGFALEAGWTGEPLGLAVAMAMAASGGDDAYHWTGQVGARPDQRGLWAVDVTRYPEPGNADLYDPNVNARWAHQLWRGAGESWAWHQGWLARGWLAQLPAATAAIQHPAGRWQPGGWQPPTDLPGVARAVAAQATVTRDYRPLAAVTGGGGGISDVGIPLIGARIDGSGMADSRTTPDDRPWTGWPVSGRDGSDVQDDIGDDGTGEGAAPVVLGGRGQAAGGDLRPTYPRRRRSLAWGTA